ncbi:hypothetical protein NUV26_06925 [Burkholderia pseudomultivorans]|uniref:hypothetical protein n=1 Tax=Burkholderia pseudomultivorans TaxID=1207504 RepID=UPI0001FD9F25|nr:hypothetical protein [Burkholderia pseudomultivorans]EGD03953.1 hypothetical protein B1M_13860 [Burkholderia sp. TJI49]AOI90407.1 hypothetical protein WS57_16215 [Burkholderia pseudomultivorans]KVC18098.1 hypothetical protein WS55_24450 [Burkholderia pseudomultivorans]KVC32973.1 hypothetical protein WS56_13770 [Burkholderia pseudomultivorans]KVC57246.1 hypothetical protein WS58_28790 [Burkholderia pseudomultivorans]
MVLLLIGLVCANGALVAFALHVDPLTGRIGHAARRASFAWLRARWRVGWLAWRQVVRDTLAGRDAGSRPVRLLATGDRDARAYARERIGL